MKNKKGTSLAKNDVPKTLPKWLYQEFKKNQSIKRIS